MGREAMDSQHSSAYLMDAGSPLPCFHDRSGYTGRSCLRCEETDVIRLRKVLSTKTRIGFDLDNTLHESRRSSGAATSAIFEKISNQYAILVPALKTEYLQILRTKTADTFTDGETSFDYRRERFSSFVCHFSVSEDEDFVTGLLEHYESTLTAALELKSGVMDLLVILRSMGKKIVVITEGPQDAQERTLKALGIDKYVGFLATTNFFRVSKMEGLFSEVLHHSGISASDIAYIGDSQERDMTPAMADGIISTLDGIRIIGSC